MNLNKVKLQAADEYVNQGFFRLEYGNSGTTAKECKQAVDFGFNACLDHLSKSAGERKWNIQIKHGKVMSGAGVFADCENVEVVEHQAYLHKCAQLAKAVEAMTFELDCGDSSCYFAQNPEGMRTNGGCRCSNNRLKIHDILRKQRAVLSEIGAGK